MCPGMAIEPTVPRISETAWWRWLLSLNPWEMHFLVQTGRELDWHDDYVNGLVSLDEMTSFLARHFDSHSVRVDP